MGPSAAYTRWLQSHWQHSSLLTGSRWGLLAHAIAVQAERTAALDYLWLHRLAGALLWTRYPPTQAGPGLPARRVH